MSKPILYYMGASIPSRAVVLTIKALDLDVEYKTVDVLAGDQLKPEFIELNPQHTIPTLDDDGVVVWDSHAILTYLADKYDETESLYPKNLPSRATVNQRLHFDSGALGQKWYNIVAPIFAGTAKVFPEEALLAATEAYDLLEIFVKDGYVVGDQLSIADFSIIATISSMTRVSAPCSTKHPKLFDWMRRMSQLPYYNEANGKFVEEMHNIIIAKLLANSN